MRAGGVLDIYRRLSAAVDAERSWDVYEYYSARNQTHADLYYEAGDGTHWAVAKANGGVVRPWVQRWKPLGQPTAG
jgi:hypothetical protein